MANTPTLAAVTTTAFTEQTPVKSAPAFSPQTYMRSITAPGSLPSWLAPVAGVTAGVAALAYFFTRGKGRGKRSSYTHPR